MARDVKSRIRWNGDPWPVLTVGDKVLVFPHSHGEREPVDGVVTKVGRTLVHIDYGSWSQGPFRLETGLLDGDTGSGPYFKTPEEADRDQRRSDALEILRHNHLEGGHRCRLPLEVLERLAGVLIEYENARVGEQETTPK